jgi:hypothetical protein
MPDERYEATTITVNPDGSTNVTTRTMTDEEQAQKDREAAFQAFLENDDPTAADKLEILRILVQQKLNGEVL